MGHKAKVGIDMRNDSLKREVAFLHVMQRMREEMDLAWKDFFEKNAGKKEEDVWRRVEERLRSKQHLKDKEGAEALRIARRRLLCQKEQTKI